MKKRIRPITPEDLARFSKPPNIDTKSMTFREFVKGKHEGMHNLYIVWNGSQALYVGVSGAGVWNRWFSSMGSHMMYTVTRKLVGNSEIGREIEENLPDSLEWTIELRYYGVWNNKDLMQSEYELIRKLHPLHNYIHNW